MEPTSFLPLLASVFISFLGLSVYLSGARDGLHRLFLAACLIEAYWSFATFELLTAGTLPEAKLWARAGFLWSLGFAALVHLSIRFLRYRGTGGRAARDQGGGRLLLRGALLLALYVPGGAIALLDLLTDRVSGLPWRTAHGWTVTPLYTAIGPAAVAWALGALGIGLLLSIAGSLTARDRAHRLRLLFMSAGLFSVFAAMLAIDAILPFYKTGYQDWISVGLAVGMALSGYGIAQPDRAGLAPGRLAAELGSLMPSMLLFVDPAGRIRMANPAALSLLGYPEGELLGAKALSLLVPRGSPFPAGFWSALRLRGECRELAAAARRKDGSTIDLLLSVARIEARRGIFSRGRPLPAPGAPEGRGRRRRARRGRVVGFLCIGKDVTEVELARAGLTRSLEEKELLVREAYHRIKNNLAIVGSFINLYQEQVSDPGDRAIMSALKARVRSISLVHEQLHQGRDLKSVDFAAYARLLLENLRSSFMPPGIAVEVIVLIETTAFSIDRAVTLGLVLTELSTNALKYGFDGVDAGQIRVEMGRDGAHYRLAFSNNGRPIPDLDAEATDSLGLRLVRALVDQLDGSVELKREPETQFIITFPVEE